MSNVAIVFVTRSISKTKVLYVVLEDGLGDLFRFNNLLLVFLAVNIVDA